MKLVVCDKILEIVEKDCTQNVRFKLIQLLHFGARMCERSSGVQECPNVPSARANTSTSSQRGTGKQILICAFCPRQLFKGLNRAKEKLPENHQTTRQQHV